MRTVDVHSLGGRIRSLRINSKLSLKQLSERAGVSISMLSSLERNSVDPSLKSLRKIADALAVSVGYMVDGPARPNNNEPIELSPVDANGAPVDE